MGMDYLSALCDKLCINSCVDAYEAENGHEFRVSRSGMLDSGREQ